MENDKILILYKPRDITSFKYINNLKKENTISKIGHAGTLDPMAEGLMIVMCNNATKFSNLLMHQNKTYYVELEFGYETDTFDLEGNVTNENKNIDVIDNDLIINILNSYIKKFKQIPPMYSAIKKNGIKLCDLARNGITFELKGREVEIFNIYDISFNKLTLSFRVDVSSGTYIRSLVRDIGRDSKYYATMTKLIREKIGNFTLNDLNKSYIIDEIFDYDKIEVNYEVYKSLKNGMTKIIKLNLIPKSSKLFVYYENNFVGIVEIIKKLGYNYYIKRNKYFK